MSKFSLEESKKVVPYQGSDLEKKEQVALMFNNIAHNYDFLNRLLSLGIDKYWRWRAINELKEIYPSSILDVATGTADVAIATTRVRPKNVVGIDISDEMLAYGKEKVKKQHLDKVINLQNGDAENLSFQDNTFDAITVAFGVRNFQNLEKGINELYRVLRPGGKLVILEFSKPKVFPVKQIFGFYFRYLLPFVGKYFSQDERAYTYLPESVKAFPEGKQFVQLLNNNGFKLSKCISLSFGIASIYTGRK